MNYYPYSERSKLYRSVLTAVASEQPFTLRLLLHNDAHCLEAFLMIKSDGGDFEYIKMQPSKTLEDYRFYECEIKKETGLYFYGFKYTSEYGDFYVSKAEKGLGTYGRELNDLFQLTVYDKSFKTPDWLKGGIIYQIFPDRFYASGKQKSEIFEDRYIVSDRKALPEHNQTADKKTLGNDYFCGDLEGIRQKLDYLKELGVTCIYLNPIFEAHSNHRYNTADYLKIDRLLGDESDLKRLCSDALKRGIKIILDGVFSHTGDDSIYFNKYNRYESIGAYQSPESPYFSWYKFNNYPDDYSSWWGVKSLPETNEENESFSDFITGENGVIKHWLKVGVNGFRLDVADELPDRFLEKIRTAIKSENSENYLLGEVWEDATNKVSYGARRKFLQGFQLDSVMNYPFSQAIVEFIKNKNADFLNETVLNICSNYPPQSLCLMMNHIGTHDTARILTRLSDTFCDSNDRDFQSKQTLNDEEYQKAKKRLMLAAVIQYTLPGVPSLYYGDEIGTEGYGDPFCRKYFDWDNIDTELLSFYKSLGKMRRKCIALKDGDYLPIEANGGFIAYERQDCKQRMLVAVNRGDDPVTLELDAYFSGKKHIIGTKPESGKLTLCHNGYCAIW